MKEQYNHSKIYKIDGVGIDLERFYPIETLEKKNSLRTTKNFLFEDFILIYTAEFIPRKNHKFLFGILPELKKRIPLLKLILCGKGELLENYKKFAVKNNMDYVFFTGYTKDIADYCRLSDVLVMPSYQEGLPMAMVEAIATGLPVVASDIRGHCDVVEDCVNGFLVNINDAAGFIKAIITLYKNPMLRIEMGIRNIEKAKIFSVKKTVDVMEKIYENIMTYI